MKLPLAQIRVETFLRRHQIPFQRFLHPAVFTVADGQRWRGKIPGTTGKSLFLKDSSHHQYFLLSLAGLYRADIKKFRRLTEAKKFTFARDDELAEILGVQPGSVSPFGLLNDKNRQVQFYLDQSLATAKKVGFHPNINTATLLLRQDDFRRFLKIIHQPLRIVDIAKKD